MNYRHAFHAGNFADVHKHVVLLATLRLLQKKEKPLFILDTHAGRGLYDLSSEDSRRGNEFRDGFVKLNQTTYPPLISDYVALVRQISPDLTHYPGSPKLTATLLRPGDRNVLCELNPSESRALQSVFRGQESVGIHTRDGYEALGALLPPKERRGLILIDPPFEQPNEYQTLLEAIVKAHRLFSTGTYLLWMPLKSDQEAARFLNQLAQTGIRRIFSSQLWVEPKDSPQGLLGSGIVIINPPYQLDQSLIHELPILAKILARGPDFDSDCRWLVAE